MDRLGPLGSGARRYAPGILSALAAAESATKVALRRSSAVAASRSAVSLAYAPDQLSVQVQDNGHGMAPGNGHSPGHGLIGIRERVRLHDGEMITSRGFVLRVRLPLTRQPL